MRSRPVNTTIWIKASLVLAILGQVACTSPVESEDKLSGDGTVISAEPGATDSDSRDSDSNSVPNEDSHQDDQQDNSVPPIDSEPTAPSIDGLLLEVVATANNAITLRWSHSDESAVGFDLLRDNELLVTIDNGLRTYTDKSLTPGQEYSYSVRAFNENGQRSDEVSVTATTITNNPPQFKQEPGQLVIENSLSSGDVITALQVSDADEDVLSYRIVSGNDDHYFSIDADSGEVLVDRDLVAAGNKVFKLLLEVSDGYSITSASLQIGVVALSNASEEQQGLLRQVYKSNQIGTGATVDRLRALSAFPNSPNSTNVETSFEAPRNIGDFYGQRMHGYLVPKVSGDYRFKISADNDGELFLSDSTNIEAAKLIAISGQKEAEVISLQAGKAYYISALMVESKYNDSLTVTWSGPSFDYEVIAGAYLRQPLDMIPPSVPENVRAVKNSENSVILEWEAAKDNSAVTEYRIYSDGILLGFTTEISTELTDLINGKVYRFSVVAVDAMGNESSGGQQVAVVIDDSLAPTAPNNLLASDLGYDHVELAWKASSDEANTAVLYRIYQGDDLIGSSYELHYLVEGLSAENDYSFSIKALDLSGNASDSSNVLSVTTQSLDPMQPQFVSAHYQFGIASNSDAGHIFGSLEAQDPKGLPVTYSIVAGNDSGYFSIADNGDISLATALNINQPQQKHLIVRASNGNQAREVNVRVNILDALTLNNTGVSREMWTGLSGSNIIDLNMSRDPSVIDSLVDAETPSNIGSHYGQRLRAFLQPKVSGSYSFWLASDDASELRLSTDMDPANAELIAKISGHTSIRNWSNSNRVKTNIELQAGRLYYLEVLHKEGSGGDHLSIAWKGDGVANKTLLSGDYLLPFNALVPAMPQLDSGAQSGFNSQGDRIGLNFSISEQAAGFPVTVYYGLRDGGTNTWEWQQSTDLGSFSEGDYSIELENIEPGQRYYVRLVTEGAMGSTWSSEALIVDTVVVEEGKTVGESLPQSISLTVEVNGEAQYVELNKHSVRSPNYQLLTFDDRRQQPFEAVVPMPETRTYRGVISNNSRVVVTGVVNDKGQMYLSGWSGRARIWTKNADVSDLIDSDALGNETQKNDELILGHSIPAAENNRLYLPQPGGDFHNNLARISFLFENPQFTKKANSNLINAVAQMEGQVNEFDYVWAQKTGLRWDIGRALIEVSGSSKGVENRPKAQDSTNFKIDFQDPHGVGYCWGGGDWVGCVAGYRMPGVMAHELGHNMGLGHSETADNAGQTQSTGTQLGSMQARKTTRRLQAGSKFKVAKPLDMPMLPAAFKDYVSVNINESRDFDPLANDYDANGDVLSLEDFETTTQAGGQVIRVGDQLRYTPPAGFVGTDQCSYTVSDGERQTVGPVQIQVLKPGLVANWDMEQASGEMITDLSGEGNHLYAKDKNLIDYINGGISGDGIGYPLKAIDEGKLDAIGHKLLPHVLDPGHKSFTASLWFQYSDVAGKQLLMGKSNTAAAKLQYGGWEIRTENHNLVMQVSFRDRLMQNNTISIKQEESIIDGNWHQAVVVIDRDAGKLTGYLDGIEFDLSADLPLGDGPIMAARNFTSYGGGTPFRIGDHAKDVCVQNEAEETICTQSQGQSVDNARIYHRALNSQEVQELYQHQM